MTVAQGRGAVLEAERSGCIGTELKAELVGLPDGKNMGDPQKREKYKITPKFYISGTGSYWCNLLGQGKL